MVRSFRRETEGVGLEQPIHAVRAPLGIGEVLDLSLRLYRRAFLPILGISALFVVPYTIAGIYVSVAQTGELFVSPLLRMTGQAPVLGPSPEDLVGQTYLFIFIGMLLGTVAYAALVHVATQLWRGETPTLGGALLRSLRRLFAMLVTGLIVGVAGVIFSLITMLLSSMTVGLGVSLLATTLTEGGETLQVIIGLVVILVAGFLLQFAWIGFLYVPQSIMIQNRGYFGAIGTSLSLIYTHLLRSMGLFWALWGFIASLSMIYLLPELLWQTAVGETGLHLVGAVANGLITLLLFPLLPLVTTVAYYDLRLRSEAPDLADQLKRLEEGGGAGA